MWGIIPTIALLVFIYFFEQRGIERDEAKKEVRSLAAKNEELTKRNIELSNLKCNAEQEALKDAFLLLCKVKEASIPEGYSLEQIANTFAERACVMLVCNVKDLEPKKIEYYINGCVRYIRNSNAIRKFLDDNGIVFNEAYSFELIFSKIFNLRVNSKNFEEAVKREIASVPDAFTHNAKMREREK